MDYAEYFGKRIARKEFLTGSLESDLEDLHARLSPEDFRKMMTFLGTASVYSPKEKAAAFNQYLKTTTDYPAYMDVLRDWGAKDENADQFTEFIQELTFPEVQRDLSQFYLALKYKTPEEVGKIIEQESDMSTPSFLGKTAELRVYRMAELIDTRISGKDLTPGDAVSLIEGLKIDAKFKKSLLDKVRKAHPEAATGG